MTQASARSCVSIRYGFSLCHSEPLRRRIPMPRSVRAAERAVYVALRFDVAIALLLVERGDCFVGFGAGIALAKLACAATAVGGGLRFHDFGYVASRQSAACRADEVAIVALVGT